MEEVVSARFLKCRPVSFTVRTIGFSTPIGIIFSICLGARSNESNYFLADIGLCLLHLEQTDNYIFSARKIEQSSKAEPVAEHK